MAESLVGVGFAFPMRLDPAGAVALVAREHKIEQSIRLILATAQGERPMRPDFGSGVHNYVFSSDDAVTAGRLAYRCAPPSSGGSCGSTSSTCRSPPKVHGDDCLLIEIHYVIRGTNDPQPGVSLLHDPPESQP
jgi:hypothetical protein